LQDHKKISDRSSISLEYIAEKGLKIERTQVGFTKPRKEDSIPKPKIGWDLMVLKEWAK